MKLFKIKKDNNNNSNNYNKTSNKNNYSKFLIIIIYLVEVEALSILQESFHKNRKKISLTLYNQWILKERKALISKEIIR